MGTAAISIAQEEDKEQRVDEEDIFDRVVSFLAAITRGLLRRVLGADDPSFRPVMGKRGEAGAAAGATPRGAGSSSSGATTVAASASETPRRWAKAASERVGASPRVRSAARRAGRRCALSDILATSPDNLAKNRIKMAIESRRRHFYAFEFYKI
jgi:hypothetical protein